MPGRILKYYKKLSINEKLFLIMRVAISLESIYFLCYGNPFSIPAFLMGISTLIVIIIYLYKGEKSTWKQNEIKLYILIVMAGIELYLYFLSSSRIAASRELMDSALVKVDDFLLGRLFPKGQISLYLDENKTFGPTTIGGKIINNILVVFYYTYYANPYVFIFIILFRKCIQETIYRYKNNGQKSPTYNIFWNRFYFTLSVYIATYIQIFFINVLVPAKSPRIYFKGEYKNEIIYYGLNKFMTNIKDDDSANSFPSGHVAETFCLVFPFYAMKKYFIGTFVLIVSLLIALATVILRYHYFVDALVGMFNSTLAFLICYFIRIILKIRYPEQNGEIKIDGKLIEKIEIARFSDNKDENNENQDFDEIENKIQFENNDNVENE